MNSHYKLQSEQFHYARAMTRRYSKSFYFSTCLLPQKKRWATFALYSFCRHADNLIDNPRLRNKSELHREVRYLQQEIQTAYRTGESEHPVIQPFITVAKQYGIDEKYPQELIRGVQMDMERTHYETFDDLYLFCYRVAGVVGIMMTPLLGYKNTEAFYYAEKLGVAMQLTNIIRDIREDKNMGRFYFPVEELNSFGCDFEMIKNEKMNPAFQKFMKFQIDRAHSFYREAEKGIAMLDKDARFAIISASKIYRGILSKLELRNYNPFLGRVFVPQRTKVGIVLREVLKTKILSYSA